MEHHVKEKFLPWMRRKSAEMLTSPYVAGGAIAESQRILDICQAYECGKLGYHPTMIEGFVTYIPGYDADTTNDWEEYQRLKKKFGE